MHSSSRRQSNKDSKSSPLIQGKNQSGFGLTEILIVVAIVGVIASLGFVQGRRLVNQQNENATVHALQQMIASGASAASARGEEVILRKDGNEIFLIQDTKHLEKVDIPNSVTLKTSAGTTLANQVDLLSFSPTGLVDSSDIAANFAPLNIVTTDKTYALTASLIGDTKVETP